MRITGGSYGTGGSLEVNDDGSLTINGAVKKLIPKCDIASVETETVKSKGFSSSMFLLLALVLGLFGFFLAAGLGLVVGLLLAGGLSFTQGTTIVATATFTDGSRVIVEAWHYKIQKLVKASLSQ